MKKIFLLLLLLFVLKAEAQQSVIFKMKYQPNHSYDAVTTLVINGNVNLSGDTNIIKKLTSQGITQPIILNLEININGNTKTGSTGTSNNFPLTMKYDVNQINITVNGKKINIPQNINQGKMIYGHVNPDGKLKGDSIGGSKQKDTSQKNIAQLINSVQNKIQFPDHALKVGDTFTQDVPLNIPMGGNNTEADVKLIYKLVKIDGGNAYFDVDQSMNMLVSVKQSAITLIGSGNGKMVYDIKNSFPADYSNNLNLKFSGKFATLTLDGTAQLNTTYKYTIN
jgi:hypothetical protein